MRSILHVAQNFIRPEYRGETVRKALHRLRRDGKDHSREEWYQDEAIDASEWANKIDPDLWREAELFNAEQDAHTKSVLSKVGVKLGGGAHTTLLYFLVRYLRCKNVLETGVAAGHSSRAFLKAIEANGGGVLVSSDFPYLRIKDPEKFIGVVVEPELRGNWTLMTRGDRLNLPIALQRFSSIDLFHYDSDKSYSGRVFALDLVRPKLTRAAPVVFDDIDDNPHFHDLCAEEDSVVFRFGSKKVGLVCGADSPLRKWLKPARARVGAGGASGRLA